MAVDESANWDATETAAKIRSGAVSALEMVDAAIARAEALDPQLNFLVTDDFERARERARGPLGNGPFAGVPYLIKDLDDMAGLPTRSGSRSTADLGPATRQTALIDGMLATGLNPIGKSSTPEHGFLPTSEPLAFWPNRPQHEAGMRIDPPPSEAWAKGTTCAAVAAPAPPDEPPEDRVGSHGLRVGPKASGSVVGRKPCSGVELLPIGLSPVASMPSISAVCRVAGPRSAVEREPERVGSPAMSSRSLIRKGTPATGPLPSGPHA